MPENTPPRPICAYCDGFPQVAIATGQRTPDGQRRTIAADCPACHGTGRALPARSNIRVGV